MNQIWKFMALVTASVAILAQGGQAQTLVNSWSYAGGGLDAATYGGDYNPSTLVPDSANSNGATISVSGMTTGGLGSSGFGDYEGIYTFFSANPSFTMQTTTLLDDLDQISFSFLASAGDSALVYDSSSLTLNYNVGNSSVASTGFSAVSGIIISGSPLGPQTTTRYTWTWSNLSALGVTTGFSTSWDTQSSHHVFYDDLTLTQAVPEPTTVGLMALGGALFLLRRKRTSRFLS